MWRKRTPADVVALVASLAAPVASYMTERVLAVNGGRYM
jgi:NAD(P)-dependent dehydrogenase (short-subunit alcohol dehydrogenase family)